MKEVVFTKDFATKKAGDIFLCSPILASDLVKKGVAKYNVKKEPKESK